MEKIYFREGAQEKINRILADGANRLHILMDFDRTITLPSSYTSWATLTASKLLPEEYGRRRNELFDHYHPFEIDPNLDLPSKRLMMSEWWRKHLDLIMEFKPTKSQFEQISNDQNYFSLRPGTDHVLKLLNELNVPVIIITAGIGNFVQMFLEKEGLMLPNVRLISNVFTFDASEVVNGVENIEHIVHVANKNENALPDYVRSLLHSRMNIMLLGDTLEDLQMADLSEKELLFGVGFLERNPDEYRELFKSKFDLVLEDQQPMDEVLKIIKQF